MIQLGEIQIALITDGVMHVDAGGAFGLTPRPLYRPYFEPDAHNLIPMALHCLLVRAAGKTVVVDTGLGQKLAERQRRNWGVVRDSGNLIDWLARLGVRPENVDLVINTHLHADHAAGDTIFGADEHDVVPTFPNAEYVVQRREYEDAVHPNERTAATYLPVNYQPLVESGRMRLLDGDTEILPGIHGVITRGHTPAHMSIRFESQGQHALFVADMASYAVHFEKLGWMTAYDVEPLQTLESKRHWQQWAMETDALLIFQHDPTRRAGRLVQDGDKRVLDVVELPYGD
jgi:glyoxylase-like metal-dependent hydrolase (beta-lactamase superfamily II)